MKDTIDVALAMRHYPKKLLNTIKYFRNIALSIDSNPETMSAHLHQSGIRELCFDRNSDCLSRVELLEALSYGDAGALLACPGPSLSGLMLRELGSIEQNKYFFSYIEDKKATTFFAVTEPNKGSDVGQMQTYLKKINKNCYKIYGEKWLVGHGADAAIGVLVARTTAGPLGIISILLTPEIINSASNTLYRQHLKSVGLQGARLSQLIFNGLEVTGEHILGAHLSPINRGMMAVMKTFNRMRPAVAAFALGHAQAVIDYIRSYFHLSHNQLAEIERIDMEIMSVRLMLHKAAQQVDQYPLENSYVAIAKMQASAIAEKATILAVNWFGVAYLHHPLLMKWQRDVYGYEYMEGTSHIQRQHIYQKYIRSDIAKQSLNVSPGIFIL